MGIVHTVPPNIINLNNLDRMSGVNKLLLDRYFNRDKSVIPLPDF